MHSKMGKDVFLMFQGEAFVLQAYSGEQFYAETMQDDVQRVNALFQVGLAPLSAPPALCAK